MKNLAKHILAEKENIEKALSYLKVALEKEDKSAAEIAGSPAGLG